MNFEDLLDLTAQELGLESLAPADTGVAALRVDDQLTVLMEKSPFNHETVAVYASLGSAPASGREAFFEVLLEAQLFDSEVAPGTSFGLLRETGEVFLNRSYALANASAEEFVEVLNQFVNWAVHWKQRLAAGVSASAGVSAAAEIEPEPALANFVRI
ncbi:type III secretion system chaperone [Verrucomicrobium sp. BvORR034]|uniref:type III secretion system chaperone n=1 Tax=Verrucomicrobium sp. BvORR034 TaxID=1396418 RepID=UPI00067929F5|nr:type III secretion system chaperone [Verrucomicrobium sp. BvORR034]